MSRSYFTLIQGSSSYSHLYTSFSSIRNFCHCCLQKIRSFRINHHHRQRRKTFRLMIYPYRVSACLFVCSTRLSIGRLNHQSQLRFPMIHCSFLLHFFFTTTSGYDTYFLSLSSSVLLMWFSSYWRPQVRLLLIQIKCLDWIRERMSYNEFKARALYDFNSDGPNELGFYAGDILTITSTAAGHGWW